MASQQVNTARSDSLPSIIRELFRILGALRVCTAALPCIQRSTSFDESELVSACQDPLGPLDYSTMLEIASEGQNSSEFSHDVGACVCAPASFT